MEGEGEAKTSSSSSSQQEEEEEEQSNAINDYEQQRLERIRENKARLEALGLPSLASSLLGSSSPKKLGQDQNKGKKKQKKNGDDDDEYRPSDEDEEEEDVGPSSSSRQQKGKKKSSPNATRVKKSSSIKRYREDFDQIDEDVALQQSKKKSSTNSTRVKKSLFIKRPMEEFDQIDEDAAIQQAIALSLGGTTEGLAVGSDAISPSSVRTGSGASVHVKKDKAYTQQNTGRRKSGKMNKSRVQLTEDEVVAYFFSFDAAGTGHISLRDLQRMVLTHDFSWTEMEIASMIHSFDSDRDGKVLKSTLRWIKPQRLWSTTRALPSNSSGLFLLSFAPAHQVRL